MRIYIALYQLCHALLKTLLHKTNEILFNKGKEMLVFESEKKLYILYSSHRYAYGTEATFLHNSLEILKHTLQNF